MTETFDPTDDLALVARLQAGDPGAMDALIRRHAGMVRTLAMRFEPLADTLALDDLVQEARIALLKAARTFTGRGRVKFSTYAWHTIRHALADVVRRDWPVHVTANLPAAVRQAARDLENEGAEVTVEALHARINARGGHPFGRDVVAAAWAALEPPASLDARAVLSGDEDTVLGDLLPAGEEARPVEDAALEGAVRAVVERAIAHLDERDHAVFRMYYDEDLDSGEIARRLGMGAVAVKTCLRRIKDAVRRGIGYMEDELY